MGKIRSRVASNAWKIHNKGLSWSYAMKKAWDIQKMKKRMHQGEVLFIFVKTTTGEVRIARSKHPVGYSFKNTTRKSSDKVTRYFDLDKQEWRSFRHEHLLEIQS